MNVLINFYVQMFFHNMPKPVAGSSGMGKPLAKAKRKVLGQHHGLQQPQRQCLPGKILLHSTACNVFDGLEFS